MRYFPAQIVGFGFRERDSTKPTNTGPGFVVLDPISKDFVERSPIHGRPISHDGLHESKYAFLGVEI
jgi:hypothetical protein